MAHYQLRELLEEASKEAKSLSVESLRSSVIKNLKHVYSRVGADALFHPGVLLVEPTPYGHIDLPGTLIKLIDVKIGHPMSSERGVTGAMNQYGKIMAGERFIDYEFMEGRLWLTHGQLPVPLTVTFWELPTDREGAPTIDDRIWQAAKFYCQSEVNRMGNDKDSLVRYQINSQAAKTEMDAARAECNDLAAPDFVKLYNALHPLGYSAPVTGAWREYLPS